MRVKNQSTSNAYKKEKNVISKKTSAMTKFSKYNGFGQKELQFDRCYSTIHYIGVLNKSLEIKKKNVRIPLKSKENYCIFQGKARKYESDENRKLIRKDIIRYTNQIGRERELANDEIGQFIGYIEYKYDPFISDEINEKVLEDAKKRLEGIQSMKKNELDILCAFITNDNKQRGLRMKVLVLFKD